MTLNSAFIWLKHYIFINLFRNTNPSTIGAKNFIIYHAHDIDWTLKLKNKTSHYSIFWEPETYIKLEKGYTKDFSAAGNPFPPLCMADPFSLLTTTS